MEMLAFIVLPAPTCIYSQLKRVVYTVQGVHESRLSTEWDTFILIYKWQETQEEEAAN